MDGTPFGRYRLVDLLGRGGMGEVWRAYDTAMSRVVALKVLPVNFADDEQYQVRFRREAQAAAALDEPHVVPIHDFGEIDGRLYVTMRLIDGKTVHELLENGPLPPQQAVWIVEQIAAALNAAHRVGLVHRDVKPSNILVTEDDFAYLIDFGIARAAGATKLTSTGATIGTLAYMAPERFTSDRADARADIYALTCVLYECLTGAQPFPGDSLERQITSHLTMPPPRPSTMQPGVSPQMDQVIATGMAKNPDARYASTKDLAAAARAALSAPVAHNQPAASSWPQSGQSWHTPLPYPDTGPNAPPTMASDQHRMAAEPSVWSPMPVADAQAAQDARPWWRSPAILIPIALLAVLVVLGVILVISWPSGSSKRDTASTAEPDRPTSRSVTSSAPSTNSSAPGSNSAPPSPPPSTSNGPSQLQTADGLTGLLGTMREKFGDTMGFQLTVYPDYAALTRVDAKNSHVEESFTYRNGGWQSFGPKMTTSAMDKLVDLGAFDANGVAARLAEAPQTLGATEPGQTYLIIGGPFAPNDAGLYLAIHSTAPGTSYMQLNPDGTIKKTYPP